MSIFDVIMLAYVLPSLCVALGIMFANRIMDNNPPGEYDYGDWMFLVNASLIWPLGLFMLIGAALMSLSPYLFKEIRLPRKPQD